MPKRNKKRWSDLTTTERVFVVAGAIVQVSLLAAAQWDLRRRPAEQINGSKGAWTAASFINFAGPIAYFLFGRRRSPIR